ncbi:peptide ABC transporter substrate-binding protein [Oceanirhabdus sp. W0125-5]|uniref:peptide ABC transporter substrate-binding protein n=1 Tax=Oceanirhabdus sp. W0125-5 TaxID=2999116 RepID=UPI0022F2E45F|nr:peptide ABC transporter substrate-binding protein [Oceanirhabdus sp. W0125-5]WBW99396.1 peptide ABC transporter substrate-binding protein [Oceanirhabdus sp. W0125-5]
MKKKKLLAMLLATTMIFGGIFTSCKNNNEKENGENTNVSSTKKEDTNKKDNNKKENTKKENTKKNDDEEKLDKDQYMNIFLTSEPSTIDPALATDANSGQILVHIMDGLTRVEQDENGDKIVPALAKRWDVSEDGLTWVFHLRDAVWSDGVPVVAEQFEYGIKRLLDPETGSRYAWILTNVILNADKYNAGEATADEVGVKAIDEKTVEFTLASPIAYFLDLTYFSVMLPQRKDLVEKFGDSFGSEANQLASTGAFTLEKWEHDSELVFKKNPKYWNKEEIKLETITMLIVNDESARMNTMLSGDVDLGAASHPDYRKMFEESGDFNYSSNVKPRAVYEMYNQNNKYLKNEKIRKALITALDREALNNVLYRGIQEPAYSWVPPTVQIGGEDFRTKANSTPVERLIEEYPDPKKLLIEGLREIGESEDPADMTVTILQSGTSARDKEFAEFEMEYLKNKLGINVKVDYYEWAIFSKMVDEGNYEIASQMWIGDYNDPNTFLEMFISTAGISPTGWVNEEYDNLIAEAAQTMDQEKRFEIFKRAEEILLYEDGVISPWIFGKTSTYTRKYVRGIIRPLFGQLDVSRAYTVGR